MAARVGSCSVVSGIGGAGRLAVTIFVTTLIDGTTGRIGCGVTLAVVTVSAAAVTVRGAVVTARLAAL
jgi:hypothetical protein